MWGPLRRVFAVVLGTGLLSLPAYPQDNPGFDEGLKEGQLEIEHALGMDFVTPHTKWGRPYAKGPVRVLFLAGHAQGSTVGREIVEFIQRFDLAAEVVYYRTQYQRLLGNGDPRFYGEIDAGTQRLMRLLDHPIDVFVTINTTLDVLPDAAQARIREAVRGGAGIVMFGERDAALFDGALPIPNPPAFVTQGTCHALGQGRGVLAPAREPLTYQVGWETTFDYQQEAQGRAILWAAGAEPDFDLSIQSHQGPIPRADLPSPVVAVRASGPLPEATLRARLRRWDGETWDIGGKVQTSSEVWRLTLPVVPAGAYHVDAFAETAEGIVNWATIPIEISDEHAVDAVELTRDWAEIGETLEGRAVVSSAPATAPVRVSLRDKDGRELVRTEVTVGAPAFDFAVEPWMPMLLRVEAALLDAHGAPVSTAYSDARVTKRHRSQFNFMMWNWPGGDLAPYGVASMSEKGVSLYLQGGDPPPFLSAYEAAYVPYTTRICPASHSVTAMLDKQGILKGGCVHDDAAMADYVRGVVERYTASRGHGVFAYSLGDENAVRMSCLSPHCLKAYRGYLADVYGDIAALNASWGTGYAAFDDIELLDEGPLPAPDAPDWFKTFYSEWREKNERDDQIADPAIVGHGEVNKELRALQAGNFARWYDREAFQTYSYVALCKRFIAAFKEIDPQAITGFEGTDSFSIRQLTTRSRQGGDLDAFVRDIEYFGPYDDPASEVVRSLARPEFPTGNWMGYARGTDEIIADYWSQVTNCMNTIQWWRWDCLEEYHGFLSPTFSQYPSRQALMADTQVVRDGFGDLILQSQMHDDAIAMLYSMPSTYIAHFDGNPTYGYYKRDHDLWHDALFDAGLQFRYVTDRMLRLGEFDASRYKVLILPLAFAMTEAEAAVITEFVRDGGTVIADVRPGLYSGRCKPLESGLLDDLFGIRRTGKRDARPIDRMRVSGELNGVPQYMEWGNWYGKDIYPEMTIDPSVELTTATSLGTAYAIHFTSALDTPVCTVNEVGKGRAILLNFPIFQAPVQGLLETLLEAAGVTPAIELRALDGGPVTGVETTRWQNGGIELVALFGSYDGTVTVQLPGTKHVYDMKNRRSLGAVDSFDVALQRSRGEVFAFLPAASPEPAVTLAPQVARRGSQVEAAVHVPGAQGFHALRIRVTAPDGRPAPWLDDTLITGEAPVEWVIPVAYNDPVGTWTVSAIDLYTNQAVEVPLTVQ